MGGAGLRLAVCLSQDPPSQNPSHHPPQPDSFHATEQSPPDPTPPPHTKQTNSFHKLLLDANLRHLYNYTATSIKRN